ncbi:MAG TPA: zf-HC2 domain-containing protein, partial [Blastocatellia bacterium]|nr:zf-HC2 domain-containing protein [Blastocatellia bacterium]
MNCPETRGLIQVYMDSELEARDTLEVQRHLEMCSPCNRTVQTLTEQDEKLRSAAREEVVNSAGLRARVLQDIRTGSRPGIRDARRPSVLQRRFSVGVRGASRWGMLARAAAVLVAAGLVVFVLLKTGVLRGAQNSAVYAEAIEDHHDHCMLENTDKRMYTDAAKINHLTLKFCRLNAPMDLSS